MLTGWTVQCVVDDDVISVVGFGLAASGVCTSIKVAEQRVPGDV
jgi:hypothetical protein